MWIILISIRRVLEVTDQVLAHHGQFLTTHGIIILISETNVVERHGEYHLIDTVEVEPHNRGWIEGFDPAHKPKHKFKDWRDEWRLSELSSKTLERNRTLRSDEHPCAFCWFGVTLCAIK